MPACMQSARGRAASSRCMWRNSARCLRVPCLRWRHALSQAASLAQVLLAAHDQVLEQGGQRAMIQWHVSNHLSEAAFVQRVLARLPLLEVQA